MLRFLFILFSISCVSGETILKTASEVAHYHGEGTPSVDLKATVIHVDSEGTIFLADSTGATFLSRYTGRIEFEQGMRLSITGTRHPGLYIGGIIPDEIEIVGRTALPPPRTTQFHELQSGEFHYQLVSVEGVARSVERTGETSANLYLGMAGGILRIQLTDSNPISDELVGAQINVSGLAAGAIDDRRRLIDPFLKTISENPIKILKEAPAQPTILTIQDLENGWEDPANIITIKGTAVSPQLNEGIFAQDETGAIRVLSTSQNNYTPGDLLTITGFPVEGTLRPYLKAKTIKKTGRVAPPKPIPLTNSKLAQTSLHSHLVTAVGTLRSRNPPVLSSLNSEIELRLPADTEINAEVGSQLRITGIWQITSMATGGFRAQPESFALLPRSPDDIELLSAPPWWNTSRLTYILGICILVGAFSATWAFILRRQVANQVRLIAQKTQNEAITEERQRIAREFHDSLEQELAGLSIRLDAVRTRLSTNTKEAALISQLGKILSRLQIETRDFINDLRTSSQPPFAESLRNLIDHLSETSTTPIHLAPVNAPEPSPREKHHLQRITKEAINNSLKHSKANKIEVSFLGGTLTITDDGTGFDPNSIPHGHFGLRGMRERCKKIGAYLDLTSNAENGTCIQVTLNRE